MASVKASALILVTALFLAGAGCTGEGKVLSGARAMSEIVIDKSEGGRQFQVDSGHRVMIRLQENPTTGYQWEVEAVDPQILSPVKSDFSTSVNSVIGAGGVRTFVFEAGSPGTTSLRLVLKRGWEPKQKAADHFEVTIQVRGKTQPVR